MEFVGLTVIGAIVDVVLQVRAIAMELGSGDARLMTAVPGWSSAAAATATASPAIATCTSLGGHDVLDVFTK